MSRLTMKRPGLFLMLAGLAMMAHFAGLSTSRVAEIKVNAASVWRSNGFEIVGYEGYQSGSIGDTWGGMVWYIVKRTGKDDVIYHGALTKWGDEFHTYKLAAIDAVKGGVK